MKAQPSSPAELRTELVRIFPGFGGAAASDEAEAPTFHGTMREFSEFFGKEAQACSEKQLRWLGQMVAAATEVQRQKDAS